MAKTMSKPEPTKPRGKVPVLEVEARTYTVTDEMLSDWLTQGEQFSLKAFEVDAKQRVIRITLVSGAPQPIELVMPSDTMPVEPRRRSYEQPETFRPQLTAVVEPQITVEFREPARSGPMITDADEDAGVDDVPSQVEERLRASGR